MAGKESTLSIVLRTVDKATAGINAVNKRIDEVTKPTRDLGKALGEFGEKSGFDAISERFHGVGDAVKEVGFKVLEVGAIIGEATHLVLEMSEQFATLGHTSEKLGVTADFLASMRYAAQKTGAPVEALDEGFTTFVQNLGQAKGGIGRMQTALQKLAPDLLHALTAAKSNEQAFRLLADGMAAITDPAKRLTIAQKTVGDSALAPMLHQGSAGLYAQQGAYIALAGSQDEAVAGGIKVEDAMIDLKAATDGIKGAIVTGLAPALAEVVDKLQEWFVAHREDVKQWAIDIGKKLPAAVDQVVSTIKGAVGTVADIVEGIGGIKVAAVILAGVIVGPLISSIVSLGIAILTTPVGWILAAIAAIVLGVYELIKHWDVVAGFFSGVWRAITGVFWRAVGIVKKAFLEFPGVQSIIDNWEPISAFFSGLWDGITGVFESAWGVIKAIVDKVSGAVDAVTGAVGRAIDYLNPFSDLSDAVNTVSVQDMVSKTLASAAAAGGRRDLSGAASGALGAGFGAAAGQAGGVPAIKVEFVNAPKGMRATAQPQNAANVDFTVGHQFGFGS